MPCPVPKSRTQTVSVFGPMAGFTDLRENALKLLSIHPFKRLGPFRVSSHNSVIHCAHRPITRSAPSQSFERVTKIVTRSTSLPSSYPPIAKVPWRSLTFSCLSSQTINRRWTHVSRLSQRPRFQTTCHRPMPPTASLMRRRQTQRQASSNRSLPVGLLVDRLPMEG